MLSIVFHDKVGILPLEIWSRITDFAHQVTKYVRMYGHKDSQHCDLCWTPVDQAMSTVRCRGPNSIHRGDLRACSSCSFYFRIHYNRDILYPRPRKRVYRLKTHDTLPFCSACRLSKQRLSDIKIAALALVDPNKEKHIMHQRVHCRNRLYKLWEP